MDSSSINAVAGAAPGLQVQAAPASANAAKAAQPAGDTTAAKDVKVDKPAEEDIRTRDPRSLQYQVDSNTKQVIATIVDDSNKTVVVQIPNEEVLRIAKAIDRMKGFLLEGKA